MMRLTNQRGVSLMLLIIMITVFGAVAIGTVTLLRTRHESYPYQVQSYQALAVADAGVQFATRYALDNGIGFTSYPGTYIGSAYSAKNTYSLGNGQFYLRYEPATSCTPGQMGNLYCKGVVGIASREVKISDFGAMIGKLNGNALVMNPSYRPWQEAPSNDWGGYPGGETFSGWRISFGMCGVGQWYGQGNIWVPAGSPVGTMTVAVSYPSGYAAGSTLPLNLARLLVTNYSGLAGQDRFVWDEICDRTGMQSSAARPMPQWDGTTMPPPPSQSITPVWNVKDYTQYPMGVRSRTGSYCAGSITHYTIDVAQLWNSDSYPLRMDFVDPFHANPPPAGTKYYVGIVTRVSDPNTYVQRDVYNQYVFTVN